MSTCDIRLYVCLETIVWPIVCHRPHAAVRRTLLLYCSTFFMIIFRSYPWLSHERSARTRVFCLGHRYTFSVVTALHFTRGARALITLFTRVGAVTSHASPRAAPGARDHGLLLLLRRAEILRAPQSSANCQSRLSAGAEWGSDEWSVSARQRLPPNGRRCDAHAPPVPVTRIVAMTGRQCQSTTASLRAAHEKRSKMPTR